MNRSERNRAYYQANRKRLLEERANRYMRDVAYRDAIKNKARISSVMRRLSARNKNEHYVMHNGKKELGYSLVSMSSIVRRDAMTLYSWCKKRVLPPNSYVKVNRGERLYSHSQVMFIRGLVGFYDCADMNCTGSTFGRILGRVWKDTFSKSKLQSAIRKELQWKNMVL